MEKPLKPIANFLESRDKDLQFILTKVNQLEKLNQKIRAFLPKKIAEHCHIAQIKENKLILIASSGAIATQIRLSTPELLIKCKEESLLNHISAIECKVAPGLHHTITPPGKSAPQLMPLLSKEAASMIQHTADAIDHPQLKAVMERIAKRTHRENK